MPVFLSKILAWSRKRPGLAFLACLVLGGGVYWCWAPAAPAAVPPPVKSKPLPGQGATRMALEKTLLDVEKENQEVRQAMGTLQRTMQQQQQAQAAQEEDAKRAALAQADEAKRVALAQEQRFDEMLKRAQAAVVAKAVPLPVQKPPGVKVPPDPARAVPAVSLPPVAVDCKNPTQVCVRIHRTEKPASFQGIAPSAARANTPYLSEGSVAEARVVTGIMASAKTSGIGGVILLTVLKPFRPPYQIQGPGRDPLPTEVPLQGCHVFAKTQPDLGSGRVIGQLFLLSCVFPDASTFVQAINGYITDADQTLGLVGRLETHTSALMAKAAAAGLLQEASAALGLARSSLVVTAGGAVQTGQGAQTIVNEIGHYYLEQARELGPTLWIEANRPARLVILEGVALDGFPVRTLLSQGETR